VTAVGSLKCRGISTSSHELHRNLPPIFTTEQSTCDVICKEPGTAESTTHYPNANNAAEINKNLKHAWYDITPLVTAPKTLALYSTTVAAIDSVGVWKRFFDWIYMGGFEVMRNARCCFPNSKGFCCMLCDAFGTEVAGRGELEAIMGKTARF